MKFVRCEWAPSLVVNWLSSELEERGIPGPVYARTLLSVLHTYYCAHHPNLHSPELPPSPLKQRVSSHEPTFSADYGLDNPATCGLEVKSLDTVKESGSSRRSRRRSKLRQKNLDLNSDELPKLAALQCLMSACDEKYDLEKLVEELCTRLTEAAQSEKRGTMTLLPAGKDCSSHGLVSEADDGSSGRDSALTSTPEELAQRYFDAFPPLSSWKEVEGKDSWASEDIGYVCIEDQVTSDRLISEIGRPPWEKPDGQEDQFGLQEINQSQLSQSLPLGMKLMMDETLLAMCDEIPLQDGNQRFEKSTKRFIPDLQGGNFAVPPGFKNLGSDQHRQEFALREEWECADPLLNQESRGGMPDHNEGGGYMRLFERGPWTRAGEEENKRKVEGNIVGTEAQVWGSECRWDAGNVWQPPAHLTENCNVGLQNDACGFALWSFVPELVSVKNGNSVDCNASELAKTEFSQPMMMESILCDSLQSLRLGVVSSIGAGAGNNETGQSMHCLNNEVDSILQDAQPNKDKALGGRRRQVILGPIGPQAALHHTDASGFSTVVPRRVVMEPQQHRENEVDPELSQKAAEESVMSGGSLCAEEENLLTSPRTHFKPIRHDSIGTIEQCQFEDGTTFAINSDPSLPPFRRSNSGSLFIEGDSTEGAPKKYMVYKEVVPRDVFEGEGENIPGQRADSLVPKFELVCNEKFCQTEFEGLEATNYSRTGGDKLEVQSQCFPSEKNLSSIWGGEQVPGHPVGEIWQPMNSCLNDYLSRAPVQSADIWNDHLGMKLSAGQQWEKEGAIRSGSSEDITVPKSLASLWGKQDLVKLSGVTVSTQAGWGSELNDLTREVIHTDIMEPWDLVGLSVGFPMGRTDAKEVWEEEPSCESAREVWEERPEVEGQEAPTSLVPERFWSDAEEFEPAERNVTFLDQFLHRRNPQRDDESFQSQTYPVDTDFVSYDDDHRGRIGGMQEDLDDLAPDWQLNDGFEWGTQEERVNQQEEMQMMNEGDCEVLLYEGEDGQTYMIPVEYLDDSLYDEIFGVTENVPGMGGSMPSLPCHAQGSSKSGFPRRSRSGRFGGKGLRRPCSFFMLGQCQREDCKFSHDLGSITCRFWQEGSCLKGASCPFMHGYPGRRRRFKSEGAQADQQQRMESGSFELDSDQDFPILGSSSSSKVGSLEEKNFLDGSLPARLDEETITVGCSKASKKKRKFITLPKSLLGLRVKESEISGRFHVGEGWNHPSGASRRPLARGRGKAKRQTAGSARKEPRQRTDSSGTEDGTVSDF